ncbi:restriction endonuclease subunit S [Zeimonas arvi]|uniref:Restriction endonuclease subunit S n=1 Tax=Zeimonas arvi TaxID=2498847 RepID=A0A5C8NZY3_9BURK|nr:restriction endonuclease subunit S [Zeimonas arvi]TXL66891.1 restriction endonuclease subunit S [Zeimonas arvi]
MSFPRYPAYKDSGVEWLGEVPAHWPVAPIKRRYSVVGGSTPKSDAPAYWDGDIVWITPADLSRLRGFEIVESIRTITQEGLDSCGTTLVPPGSLVLSTRAPIGSLGIATRKLCTNQGCKALVPSDGDESRFLAYLLSVTTEELNIRGRGTTFLELSGDELGAFRIPYPPRDEKSLITAFLDRETAKIDALIAEQERLIELLKEKRQAVISHAVTKGLDPNVPMKDSGVEWLGEVPAHWEVIPLKWLTDADRPIMYGIVLPGPDVGEGVPILKGGNVRRERLHLEALARTTAEIEAPYTRARLRANDLVYSIRGTIGDCEIVPEELEGCNITQDVARIAPAEGVDSQWLRFALLCEPVAEDLACGSLGAAVRGINIFDLKRARIPVPPAHERAAIAAHLVDEIARLERLGDTAVCAVGLLRERRAALISAAVTGQIDVRGRVDAEAV